jgi:glutamyl-tRNA synthetase
MNFLEEYMITRSRFAPSPTGYLHLGNLRTGFYAWLYARSRGGQFVLRIEDTDQERSTQEAIQVILATMEWLNLDYQEGPFYQSKRLDHYREVAEQLIEKGLAYRCYCPKERIETLRQEQLAKKEKPRYDGHCREKNLPKHGEPYVIRFKNPLSGTVTFEDQVAGPLSFQNSELDDLIIIRSDGYPTYNFCVVVDDIDMKITHVVRGSDHINNTPRQINIFNAIGAKPPVFAHVPLLLGQDGKLLSKRHGAASAIEYREQGYLPHALLNYLVRLGWSHGDQEIFSMEEMIKYFDLKKVHKAAAAFDPEKLLWLNRHYIKTLDPEIVAKHLAWQMKILEIDFSRGPTLPEIVITFRERADTLREMAAKSRFLYQEFEAYEEKAAKNLTTETVPIFKALFHRFEILNDWQEAPLHQCIEDVAKQFETKLGKVAQPLRVALTGTLVSPPMDATLKVLGKEKTLQRITRAIEYISNSCSKL